MAWTPVMRLPDIYRIKFVLLDGGTLPDFSRERDMILQALTEGRLPPLQTVFVRKARWVEVPRVVYEKVRATVPYDERLLDAVRPAPDPLVPGGQWWAQEGEYGVVQMDTPSKGLDVNQYWENSDEIIYVNADGQMIVTRKADVTIDREPGGLVKGVARVGRL